MSRAFSPITLFPLMKPNKPKKSTKSIKPSHEAEENELAKVIVRLPTFLELHANKILTAIIIIALAILVVRWQWASHAQRALASADSLAQARESLNNLSTINAAADPRSVAATRAQLIEDIRIALETVDHDTTDRSQLAEALVERGDLNWLMANMPELPGAATQPALRVDQTSAESLDNATKAYTQVLEKYPDQKLQAISARFGLAAIAENRRDWAAAKTQYEAIIADASASKAFQDQAKIRLRLLSRIDKPTYLAIPTTQATAVATEPAEHSAANPPVRTPQPTSKPTR